MSYTIQYNLSLLIPLFVQHQPRQIAVHAPLCGMTVLADDYSCWKAKSGMFLIRSYIPTLGVLLNVDGGPDIGL